MSTADPSTSATSTSATSTPGATGTDPGNGRLGTVERVLLVVAVAPLVAAVVRRSGTRWIPIGDNALIELRARDVFSLDHFPFLGTWSSASLTAGKDLNHPGPLLFDLLAVPVKLFGGATGVALGVGLINAAALVGTALVARRVAGRAGFVAGLAIGATLGFTLGSGMLTDPWNPHVLVMPALFVLVCTWAVASGDLLVLPWMLAGGSLCLQTHLGYAYLIPGLVVAAVAGAGVVYRRRWRLDPSVRPVDRRRIRTVALASIATVLVLWAQPLIEQVSGDGQGNLARIATSTGGDEPTIGPRIAVRIAGAVVAVPPGWDRSSWIDAVPYTPYDADGETITPDGLVGFGPALVGLVVFAGVLGLLARWGWRRRDRPAVVACVVAVVAVAIALVSLSIMPIGPLGLTPHQMRWLWSIGAFGTLAGIVGLVRTAPLRSSPVVSWALVALVVLSSVANLSAHDQPAGPDTFTESIPVARSISDQVREWRTDEAVVLDDSNLRYLEPYSAVVISALLQAGVDVRVDDEGLVRQLGDHRRAGGDEPLVVTLLEGRDALGQPAAGERIAFTSPLTDDEIGALLAGEATMIDEIAAFGIVLSDEGERLAAEGAFGRSATEIVDAAFDAERFVRDGFAAELVAAGALQLDPAVRDLFEDTSELRRQVGTTTVAVVVRPA